MVGFEVWSVVWFAVAVADRVEVSVEVVVAVVVVVAVAVAVAVVVVVVVAVAVAVVVVVVVAFRRGARLIVLGIDPGTTVTGYGLVRCVGRYLPTLVACGTLRISARFSTAKRIASIKHGVDLTIQKHRPSIFAIETAHFRRNVKTAMVLSELRGALISLAMEHGLEVLEYTPASWRKTSLQNGRASKEDAVAWARGCLGVEGAAPVDACEALGIAYAGALESA